MSDPFGDIGNFAKKQEESLSSLAAKKNAYLNNNLSSKSTYNIPKTATPTIKKPIPTNFGSYNYNNNLKSVNNVNQEIKNNNDAFNSLSDDFKSQYNPFPTTIPNQSQHNNLTSIPITSPAKTATTANNLSFSASISPLSEPISLFGNISNNTGIEILSPMKDQKTGSSISTNNGNFVNSNSNQFIPHYNGISSSNSSSFSNNQPFIPDLKYSESMRFSKNKYEDISHNSTNISVDDLLLSEDLNYKNHTQKNYYKSSSKEKSSFDETQKLFDFELESDFNIIIDNNNNIDLLGTKTNDLFNNSNNTNNTNNINQQSKNSTILEDMFNSFGLNDDSSSSSTKSSSLKTSEFHERTSRPYVSPTSGSTKSSPTKSQFNSNVNDSNNQTVSYSERNKILDLINIGNYKQALTQLSSIRGLSGIAAMDVQFLKMRCLYHQADFEKVIFLGKNCLKSSISIDKKQKGDILLLYARALESGTHYSEALDIWNQLKTYPGMERDGCEGWDRCTRLNNNSSSRTNYNNNNNNNQFDLFDISSNTKYKSNVSGGIKIATSNTTFKETIISGPSIQEKKEIDRKVNIAVAGYREKLEKAKGLEEETLRCKDDVDAKVALWSRTKESNLRALLSSLQDILPSKYGWKTVGLGNLMAVNDVKKTYMRAVAKCHPDKAPRDAGVQDTMLAAAVFTVLNLAWDSFRVSNNM